MTNEQILRKSLDDIIVTFDAFGFSIDLAMEISDARKALATTATSQPSNTKGQWVSDKEYWEAPTATSDSDSTDAARWRWLRAQHWSESKLCVVTNPKESIYLGSSCPSLELLDSAIDAAIAATKKESP